MDARVCVLGHTRVRVWRGMRMIYDAVPYTLLPCHINLSHPSMIALCKALHTHARTQTHAHTC